MPSITIIIHGIFRLSLINWRKLAGASFNKHTDTNCKNSWRYIINAQSIWLRVLLSYNEFRRRFSFGSNVHVDNCFTGKEHYLMMMSH